MSYLKTIVQAQDYPISLAEVKEYLNVTSDDFDITIQSLIDSVTVSCENYCGISLIQQTKTLYLDCWPESNCIELKRGPIIDIVAINIYSTTNELTTLDISKGITNSDPVNPVFALNDGEKWPDIELRSIEPIQITYRVGFGETPDDIPKSLSTGMMIELASLFENRGESELDTPHLQPETKRLWQSYRPVLL